MPYVRRRKESWWTILRNLPKLRSRSRHALLRKGYLAFWIVGATCAVVATVHLTIGRGGF